MTGTSEIKVFISSREGRSAAAKSFDGAAIDLAVRAHIRHTETRYDSLLAGGADRHEARQLVGSVVDAMAARWLGER
jgi:hypothetical protein